MARYRNKVSITKLWYIVFGQFYKHYLDLFFDAASSAAMAYTESLEFFNLLETDMRGSFILVTWPLL